jgi:nucleoside-diphosphate-sugar epimerase
MKVLITGAAGGVARYVTAALEADHELRLLDCVDPEEATVFGGPVRQMVPLRTKWPYVRADILDEEAMLAACEGMEAMIHLAADPTGLPEDGKAIMTVNVVGTYVAVDAARKAGLQRFFCASSINAFGTIYWRLSGRPAPYTTMPLTEDFTTVEEDPYSLSKRANEDTCAAFTRAYGITTAAFRFAGIYNRERYGEMHGKLQPTTVWSDDLYQWVHAEDVAAGLKAALECPSLPEFGVYTLSGPDTRCPEPTKEVLERFRPDLAANLTEELPDRTPLMSITKARKTFGYDPKYRLME